jgi:trehalose 6-phosphate phosphatase
LSRPLHDHLESVVRRVRSAHRVLLALDFDGTLAPIAARPDDVVLPRSTVSLLERLQAEPKVTLAVVSGRSIADLRRRLDIDCFYAGNHGLEIEGPGVSFLHPDALARRPALDCACDALETALREATGVFLERKGLSATVHFRLAPPGSLQQLRLTVERALRPYSGCLDLLPALRAWEVRPHVAWNKGSAVAFLAGRLAENRAEDALVVCAGDDAGDETMFEALPGALSIHVGGRSATSARYVAGGPVELVSFLARAWPE